MLSLTVVVDVEVIDYPAMFQKPSEVAKGSSYYTYANGAYPIQISPGSSILVMQAPNGKVARIEIGKILAFALRAAGMEAADPEPRTRGGS